MRCPRCGLAFEGFPALSRTDNVTGVCSECGSLEAIEQFYDQLKPQEEWYVGFSVS